MPSSSACVTWVVATVIWAARPWELRGGRFVDKLLIAGAVSRYDFWLGLRGVGGRDRRRYRAELRANLWEAAQGCAAKHAITAVAGIEADVTEQAVGNMPSHGR